MPDVPGSPWHLLQKAAVTDVLARLEPPEAGVRNPVEVVVDRVTLSSQSVLGAVSLEVRFDSCKRELWMEGREDETPASAKNGEGLCEEPPQIGEMLRDERAQECIKGASSDWKLTVEVGLDEACLGRSPLCDPKHAA